MDKMIRLLTALFGLVLLAGCLPAPVTTLAPWHPDGRARQVVVFGDSLTWDSQEELPGRVSSDVSLSINSFGGTQVSTWVPTFDVVPTGATVVVALGTNDLWLHDVDAAKWSAAAGLVRLQARDVTVRWLTLNSYSSWLRSPWDTYPKTLEYNRWLREEATQLGVEVVEWDHASYGRDDWLAPDQVHHGPAGQMAYADVLVGATT